MSRRKLALALVRVARRISPDDLYLDGLRDYFDNTCMADQIADAELVTPGPVFNIHCNSDLSRFRADLARHAQVDALHLLR